MGSVIISPKARCKAKELRYANNLAEQLSWYDNIEDYLVTRAWYRPVYKDEGPSPERVRREAVCTISQIRTKHAVRLYVMPVKGNYLEYKGRMWSQGVG